MSVLLQLRDEHFGRAGSPRLIEPLRLASERTTTRAIIAQRVLGEVAVVNAATTDPDGVRHTRSFVIDVDSDSPEARLNLPVEKRNEAPVRLDPDKEIARALAHFEQQRFILVFDGKQVESLDDVLVARSGSEAVFFYLTPLRGG